MLVLLCSFAFADPQDIPEDSDDSAETNSQEESEADPAEAEDQSEKTEENELRFKPLTEEEIDLKPFTQEDIEQLSPLNETGNAPLSAEDDPDFLGFGGDINYSINFSFLGIRGKSRASLTRQRLQVTHNISGS